MANPPRVAHYLLPDDGAIPNNPKLPLLVYPGAVELSGGDPATIFERLFASNGWTGSWRNGIYSFHHYHSTAHEVLGIYRGSAAVQFGGESGITLTASAGDAIVIPAGVGHKNLRCSPDLGVVGAYPPGQQVDMCYGKPGERPQADEAIACVSLPGTDPLYGETGPLIQHWSGKDPCA
ncbi:MAG: hypothetical protein FJ398_07420 [Verrucomicrobia bacterium]|nr:hypothetical protein [Verrucomicrobiota bacterium]